MTVRVPDPARHADVYSELCPCRGLLDLIANKWSALVIGDLKDGSRRFGDLRRTLRGATPKVLTATLRRLEQAQMVTRTVLPEVPLHVEYELTALGRSAAVPLAAMRGLGGGQPGWRAAARAEPGLLSATSQSS